MVNQNYKMDKELQIITLGDFSVTHHQYSLTDEHSSSLKLWELFKYFVTYRDELLIPENIIEAIWPEVDYQDPKRTLRALIFRLRKILDQSSSSDSNSMILHAHGCYKFKTQKSCYLDIVEFEESFNLAYDLSIEDPDRAIALYSKVINMYKNNYLSETHEYEWLIPTRNYYRRIYYQSIYRLSELLRQKKQEREIIKICQKALKHDFFEEEIHMLYIQSLGARGKIKQAKDHYKYVVEIFERELGVKPSQELTNSYNCLFEDSAKKALNIMSISECLKVENTTDQPILCSLDVFKFQCQLERRRCGRYGKTSYIGLITLSLKDYTLPADQVLTQAMKELKDILMSNLRKGDIVAQWCQAQFVVNLPVSNMQHAKRALERIEEEFKTLAHHPEIILHLRVEAIPPLEAELNL